MTRSSSVLALSGLALVTLLATACSERPADQVTASDQSAFEIEGAARGSGVCYRHVLPTSRNLCLQAYDLAVEQGSSEEEATDAVKACGFIDWPSQIQDCLRDLITSYGGTPERSRQQ